MTGPSLQPLRDPQTQHQNAAEGSPFRRQMLYLRSVEPTNDPKLWLKLFMILTTAFAGHALLGVWQASAWAVLYVLVELLEKVLVRLLPLEANRKQFAYVMVALITQSAVFCAMPIWLWFQEPDACKFAALALMVASAMHITQQRAAFRSVLACFLLPNAAFFVIIALVSAIGQEGGATGMLSVLIGLAMTVFYVVTFVQAHQKEVRSRDTQEALSQAQRLETVGRLTGGIAHDFNNLISVVSGNLQLIAECDSLDEAKIYAERARAAAGASAELTSKMLAFGRKAPLHPRRVAVTSIFGDLHGFTDRLVPKSICLTYYTAPGTRALFVDQSLLQNALLNLVINASDAMPGGGRLHVAARNHGEGKVVLEVSDSGPGIPKEILGRVTEPFFSTKEHLGRSGMGLSMVQGFVEQSGGTLKITSEAGEGTTVRIFLPAAKGGLATEVPAAKIMSLRTEGLVPSVKRKRIMLVDDNEHLLRAITIRLEKDGYRVETYLSGDEAAEALIRADAPDLLVTDAVMPGAVQGPDLIDALRAKDAKTPAILMSGYAEPERNGAFVAEGADRFVVKPLNLSDLSVEIAGLLQRSEDVRSNLMPTHP